MGVRIEFTGGRTAPGMGRGTGGAKLRVTGSFLQSLLQGKAELRGEAVKIVNTVPYFMKLERGSSLQAPDGIFSDPENRRIINNLIAREIRRVVMSGASQDELKAAMIDIAHRVVQFVQSATPVDTVHPDDVVARESYEVVE